MLEAIREVLSGRKAAAEADRGTRYAKLIDRVLKGDGDPQAVADELNALGIPLEQLENDVRRHEECAALEALAGQLDERLKDSKAAGMRLRHLQEQHEAAVLEFQEQRQQAEADRAQAQAAFTESSRALERLRREFGDISTIGAEAAASHQASRQAETRAAKEAMLARLRDDLARGVHTLPSRGVAQLQQRITELEQELSAEPVAG
ncbi:MAG: hypothetical protein J5J06_17845 [Phycisphaerae bacterium]|nr:hypothetical protein [Phycisphaerae bacterium]